MAPLTINQHTREIAQIQAPEDETDYILVECSQLSPVDLQQLQATGAQVLSREGNDDTFLCRYTEPVVDGLAKIEALPFVKLARVYHPSLVLHPEVVKHLAEGDKGTIELSVYLHSCKESGDDVFRLIREIDAEATLVQCGDTFVSVRMKPSLETAQAIAKVDCVRTIDFTPREVADCYIAMQAMTSPLSAPWATQNNPHTGAQPRAFWGDGEVIAVADTGFASGAPGGHVAFGNRVVNVIFGDPTLGVPGLPVDTAGHGTAVAGCALSDWSQNLLPNAPLPANWARCNQIAGTAPRASLFSVRVTDQADAFRVNRDRLYSLQYAPNLTPKIWNTSFGTALRQPDGTDRFFAYTPATGQVDAAANLDLEQVIVQSAGNDGRVAPMSPGNQRVFRQISGPASAKNVITVGATANMRWQPLSSKNFALAANPTVRVNTTRVGQDARAVDGIADADVPPDPVTGLPRTLVQAAINYGTIGRIASCSNKGPTQEGRIKPDLVAPGTGMLTARSSDMPVPMDIEGAPPERGSQPCPFDRFMFIGGTSFAAPVVSGLVAALRQALREVSNIASPSAATIKALLINGAKDLGGPAYLPAHTTFDWLHAPSGNWITTPMPRAPNAAQGFGLPDLDRSLVHLTDRGDGHELVISNNHPSVTQTVNLPRPEPPNADQLMLRATLVWTDPPGALMINKLRLTLDYQPAIDQPTVHQGPDPVQPMWWELIDNDRPVQEPNPNVQRITLNNPYAFTSHNLVVSTTGGTGITPFNHNGTDVRIDQPVSVVWALYQQGT